MPKILRTGTDNKTGRRVVQYDDGSIAFEPLQNMQPVRTGIDNATGKRVAQYEDGSIQYMQEPAKPELTAGRLGTQMLRSAGQGIADISRTQSVLEQRRDIPEEARFMQETGFSAETPMQRQERLLARAKAAGAGAGQTPQQALQADVPAMEAERARSIEKLNKRAASHKPMLPGSSGRVEDALAGMARFAPSMAVSAVSPALGSAATLSQIFGSSYDQYKKAGVDDERAFTAAAFNAWAQMPLEMAGNLLQIGALKNVAKNIKAPGIKRLAAFGEALAKGTAGEGVEEFLQQYPEELANVYASNPNMTPAEAVADVKRRFGQVTKQAVEAGKTGALGGALLAGAGGTIAAPFSIMDYRREKGEVAPKTSKPLASKDPTQESVERALNVPPAAPFNIPMMGLRPDLMAQQRAMARPQAQPFNVPMQDATQAQQRAVQRPQAAPFDVPMQPVPDRPAEARRANQDVLNALGQMEALEGLRPQQDEFEILRRQAEEEQARNVLSLPRPQPFNIPMQQMPDEVGLATERAMRRSAPPLNVPIQRPPNRSALAAQENQGVINAMGQLDALSSLAQPSVLEQEQRDLAESAVRTRRSEELATKMDREQAERNKVPSVYRDKQQQAKPLERKVDYSQMQPAGSWRFGISGAKTTYHQTPESKAKAESLKEQPKYQLIGQPPDRSWSDLSGTERRAAIRKALPGARIRPVGSDFIVTTKGGSTITIKPNADIVIDRRAAAQAYKRDVGESDRAAGSFQTIGGGGVISLAKEADGGTLDHEVYHAAEELVLTKREVEVLRKKYGDSEQRAEAYREWNGSDRNALFEKIRDFFARIMHHIRPTAASTMREVASGRAFEREGRQAPLRVPDSESQAVGSSPRPAETIIPQDSPWGQAKYQLVKVEKNVHIREGVEDSRVYEVSIYPGELAKIKDKNGDVEITSIEQARKINTNPERVKDWKQIYDNAKSMEKFGDVKKVNKDGKLADVPVVSLTKGCQRTRTTVERVANGVLPNEMRVEACYGGDCLVNKQFNSKFSTFENMEVRDLQLANKDKIDSWLKNKKTQEWLNDSIFIRQGQQGDDSHLFASGVALEWLKAAKKYGIKPKTVFITAGYAPVTDAQYKELLPYKDMFEIHFSNSGWFHKNEIMLRLAEFQAAKDAGLNVAIRLVTNKDNISGIEMVNEDFIRDQMEKMGVEQHEVLETPFHDDAIKKKGLQKRSNPTGDFKYICCETGYCQSCGVKCMTRVPQHASINASYTRTDIADGEVGGDKQTKKKPKPKKPETKLAVAHHGTPHIWPPEPGFPHGRPRLDKIYGQETVGEGAWAYGAGWYAAEAEDVAKSYMDNGDSKFLTVRVGGKIFYGPFINDKQLEAIRLLEIGEKEAGEFKHNKAYWAKKKTQDNEIKKIIDEWKDAKISYEKHSSLYELDIPDKDVAKFLDWDKTVTEKTLSAIAKATDNKKILDLVKETRRKNRFKLKPNFRSKYALPQVVAIQKEVGYTEDEITLVLANDGAAYSALMKKFPELVENEDWAEVVAKSVWGTTTIPKPITGGRFYLDVARTLNEDKGFDAWDGTVDQAKIAASKLFEKAGIPGTRYLDAFSRADGEGTTNFVVWSQPVLDRIALLKRNGKKLDAIREAQLKVSPSEAEITPEKVQRRGIDVSNTKNVKRVVTAAGIIRSALKASGLAEINDRIDVELKPVIDLRGKNIDKTVEQWASKGQGISVILGATTLDRLRATVEISLEQDLTTMERTAFHESFHVAAKWLLPRNVYDDLMKFYGGNEETAADAFSDFMMKRKTTIGATRRAFNMLAQFFRRVGNALRGRGFKTPEMIFGDLVSGSFRPLTQPIEATKTEISLKSDRSVGSRQSDFLEPLVDSTPPDPKFLSDFVKTEPFRSKGFGGLDIPTQRLVLNHVRAISFNTKIRDSIIELIPIDVVNNFIRGKFPPQMLLHNQSMLSDLLTVDSKGFVPIGSETANSLVVNVAKTAAKLSSFSEVTSGEFKNLPAVDTDNFGSVPNVLSSASVRTEKSGGFFELVGEPDKLFATNTTRNNMLFSAIADSIGHGVSPGDVKSFISNIRSVAEQGIKSKKEKYILFNLPITPEMRQKALTEGMTLFKVKEPETKLSVANNPFTQTQIDRAREVLGPRYEKFMYWMVDKNHPIQTIIKRLGGVSEDIDLFMRETQRPKIQAARVKQAWEDNIQPLLEALAKEKVSIPELEEYTHAVHVKNDNANLKLRKSNAKRFYEAGYKKLTKTEKFLVTEAVKAKLGIYKIEDMKTPDQYYQALEKLWVVGSAKVAETKRAWEKFSEKPAGMTDQEAAEIVARYSSDPKMEKLRKQLAAINDMRLDMLHDAGIIPDEEYTAYKNKYKFYAPLHREGFEGGMPAIGVGIQPAGKPVKTRMGSNRKVVNILANTVANLESAIVRVEKARSMRVLKELVETHPDPNFWEMNAVKKAPTVDKFGNIRMYPDLRQVAPHEIRIMVDGKQYLITANEENKTVMRMLRTLKAVDTQAGTFVNALHKVMRWLAAINTSLSPEFMISNWPRDLQTAMVNIHDTGVGSKKMVRGALKAARDIWNVERGKPKGRDGEAYYKRYKAAGGKIGWADVHGSVENLGKKLHAELAMLEGKAPTKKKIKQIAKLIEDGNTAVENGIRLHVFTLAVSQLDANGQRVFSDAKAAQIASDLTVDFTKKGAAGPAINALYLFANAGIQGSYRIIRAGVKSPKVRKIMGGIVALGFANGLLNALAGGDDDDGEAYYHKIEDFIKERNMIFMLPGTKGKYLKIPLPWGYNLFYNIGEEASRLVTAKNYSIMDGTGRLLSTTLNAFNPIQAGTLLQTAAPTLLDPIAQVGENKNWFGGPLMPEQNPFSKVKKPDSRRFFKSSRETSQWVARQLNDLTGGSEVRSGKIDISPETIDLLVDTAGGSMLRFFTDTVALPKRVLSEEETNIFKVPFLRRVAGQKSVYSDSQRYFRNITEVLTAKAELDEYRGTDYYKQLKEQLSAEARLLPLATATEKQLRKLRKLKRAAEAAGNDDRAKNFEEKINALYVKFNTAYNKQIEAK